MPKVNRLILNVILFFVFVFFPSGGNRVLKVGTMSPDKGHSVLITLDGLIASRFIFSIIIIISSAVKPS